MDVPSIFVVRAYLLAAAVTGGMALGLGSRGAPWIWLPIALAALLSGLLAGEQWLREEKSFLGPLSVALLGGVTTGWVASSQSFPHRTPLFVFFALLAAGSVFKAVIAYERLAQVKRRAGAWVFVVIAMAWIVSVGSSAQAGAGGMIHWVVAHLGLSPDAAGEFVHVLRKTIHFCFYGFLGLSAGIAAKIGRRAPGSLSVWAAPRFGFLTALIVASFDELRQTTQPGRNGSVYDVLLDITGATAFLVAMCLISTRRPAGP